MVSCPLLGKACVVSLHPVSSVTIFSHCECYSSHTPNLQDRVLTRWLPTCCTCRMLGKAPVPPDTPSSRTLSLAGMHEQWLGGRESMGWGTTEKREEEWCLMDGPTLSMTEFAWGSIPVSSLRYLYVDTHNYIKYLLSHFLLAMVINLSCLFQERISYISVCYNKMLHESSRLLKKISFLYCIYQGSIFHVSFWSLADRT